MNHRNPLLWLTLILLTLISYALTDSSTLPWITGVIMALTALKGLMIVDGFMELQGVRHWLRRCMNLYCPLLGVLIWWLVSR